MSFSQPFSNYEILARIGSGAMGTVFKARQKHMNRIVALKVLKPALARDERYVERLRREARIVGKLNHPHIVTGYDLGEEGGYHFFVMEFVEGRSLRQLLHEWGMFPEEQVLDVAVQIAGALAHAYDCGVIHRDVKPGNILIDKDGRVKLTDMGLAKVETDLQLTREGATVGTPQYISPEQARDPRSADARSDLYSLGATLFHMATGQTPFHADTIGELITKVLHDRPPTALSVNPALSDGLSLVIRKLLSKDPELRYQTPGDLLVDLQRLQRHEKPAIDRADLESVEVGAETSLPGVAADPGAVRKNRMLLGFAITAAVLLAAAVPVYVWPGLVDRGVPEMPAASGRFEADLGAAETFRERAGVIAEGRSAGVEERVLARALDALEADMGKLLGESLGEWRGARRPEAMAWLAEPQHFADVGGLLADRVVPDLVEQLGFELDAMPTARLRADAASGLAELRDAADAWCGGLVDGLLRRVERHLLGSVREEALARAHVRDFAGARQVIRRGADAFLGRDGVPVRASVPAATASRLAELEGRIEGLLLAEVDEARLALQRQGLAALEAGLAALGRVREQEASLPARLTALEHGAERLATDAAAAEGELGPFLGELGAAWDTSCAQLGAVALEVEALRAGVQEEASLELLAFAYRCLLQAGPRSALATLDSGASALGDVESFDAHRGAFDAVRITESALADAIRARGDEARARPGSDGVWVDATGRPLSFGDVDWMSVLTVAGPRPAGQDPIGRAALLLVAGRHALAVEGLDAASRRFVEASLWPQIKDAREAERLATVRTADAALARAVERRAAGDLDGLRAALEALDARVPDEGPAPTAALRSELWDWLAAQERRSLLVAEARGRFPSDFELEVLADDRVRARGKIVRLLPGENATLVSGDDSLATTSPGPLVVVPIPLAQPEAITVELEVRFPRHDQLVQGLALHVGGVACALGVLPEGEVGVVLQQAPRELLTQDDAVRRALSGPLVAAAAEAPQVTHGAWHRIKLEWVRRRGEGVEVLVGWAGIDGPRLATGRFTVREPGDSVLVRPLGPIQLRQVIVESVPTKS